MELVSKLVCFGLRQAIDGPVEEVLKLVAHWFRDHSQALPRALGKANDRAWQALGLALAGDGLLDQVKALVAGGDARALRAQVGRFLAASAAHFDQAPAAFRRECLAELKAARQARLLSADALSPAEVGRQAANFRRFTDPGGLAEGAARAAAQLADDLAPHCPHLARLLRQPTPGGPPLLVAAFAFFFRREVETNDELARGLTFDGLRQLAAAQAQGFAEVGQALADLGDRFDGLLDQLGRVEAAVVQTQAAAVATQSAVLDMQAELHRLGGLHWGGLEEVRRLLQEVRAHLATAGAPNGTAQPPDSFRIRSDGERRAVHDLLARLRQLPAEERSRVPALLEGLTRLQAGAGRRPPPARGPGEVFVNAAAMKLVWVPPGNFLMGSPPHEAGRHDDEAQHGVTLTRGFYLAAHPVTQAQWRALMGTDPSRFPGDDRPVESVSWDDCQEFCARLARKDGHAYRLPTEAEWEYACRAGTAAPFHCGATLSTDQANYDGNDVYGPGRKGVFRRETTPVGSFAANAWGLEDMHGNVYEWCADWYGDYPGQHVTDPAGPPEGDARVLRGGAWFSAPWYCRSAHRYWTDPASRDAHMGFRVCFCPAPEDE
jgi:formylglycine-generating enzyme required for sulfatase activity